MNLPRHTSYPAAPFWNKDTKDLNLSKILEDLSESKKDFSLYIHIPYCKSLCYYCGCNKEIYDAKRMEQFDPRDAFLEKLYQEILFYKKYFVHRKLKQIHLGGGTPTFLSPHQLTKLMTFVYQHFTLADSPEISVEVDPRVTSVKHLDCLEKLGFNRISLGIQEFEPKVQKAVNRVQSFSLVKEHVKECRTRNFSINFDLIYGLPYQTQKTMTQTLGKVLELSPDRIAFYRLAMIPHMFKWQKAFQRCDLPQEKELLGINLLAIKTFTENQYNFIGLDHFAKDSDSLSQAFYNKTLRRNFQGMTTHKDLEILGIGPSSISQFDSSYLQRTKDHKAWQATSMESHSFEKVYSFSKEDKIRQKVIEDLYCYGRIEKKPIGELFHIDFDEHFSHERTKLKQLGEEGLILEDKEEIRLTKTLGRLLVRAVAAVFDEYLEDKKEETPKKPLFSKLG